MRVLIAGATGAIGRPLVDRLLEAGHEVAALTRSDASGRSLRERGVEPYRADVFNRASVAEACRGARPEIMIDQLTALPYRLDVRKYTQTTAATDRLRSEATPHLIAGARATGVRRLIVQSISFITAPEGPRVHDETARIYDDAPTAMRPAVAAAVKMERAVLAADDLEPVVLRYGFFYGPGTHYAPDGGNIQEIRRRRFPLVGDAGGVYSFVHVEDAADATFTALTGGEPGLYNVTDDEPAQLRDWLPAVAQAIGAKPPLRVPGLLARFAAGAAAVHFTTTLRGNSNTRFKRTFNWTPTHPTWRTALPESLATQR